MYISNNLFCAHAQKGVAMKQYESPVLTEIKLGTEDVMLFSGEVIFGGSDPYKSDINWDLL